jgi:hypothetical protein
VTSQARHHFFQEAGTRSHGITATVALANANRPPVGRLFAIHKIKQFAFAAANIRIR